MTRILYLTILLLSLSSCDWFSEERPLTYEDDLVLEAAQERIDRYTKRKLDQCKMDILQKAELHVDTTIANILNEYISDTLYFPRKPIRPEFPEKLKVDSSLIPRPLFDSLPAKTKDTTESKGLKNQ